MAIRHPSFFYDAPIPGRDRRMLDPLNKVISDLVKSLGALTDAALNPPTVGTRGGRLQRVTGSLLRPTGSSRAQPLEGEQRREGDSLSFFERVEKRIKPNMI